MWNVNFNLITQNAVNIPRIFTNAVTIAGDNIYYVATRFAPKSPTTFPTTFVHSFILSKVDLRNLSTTRKIFAVFESGKRQWADDITIDNDGNVIVAGHVQILIQLPTGLTYYDAGVIVKFTSNGAPYEGFGNNDSNNNNSNDYLIYDIYNQNTAFNKVAVDSNNNIYVTIPGANGKLIKFNSSGVFQGSFDLQMNPADIKIDGNDRIYVAGTIGTSPSSVRFTLKRLDTAGNIIYTKTKASTGIATALAIASSSIITSTNIYITGYSTTISTPTIITARFDADSGDFIEPFGNTDTNGNNIKDIATLAGLPPVDIIVDEFGDFYITGPAGHSYNIGNIVISGLSTRVVKYCSDVPKWSRTYSFSKPTYWGPGTPAITLYAPKGIVLDSNNMIYVGGEVVTDVWRLGPFGHLFFPNFKDIRTTYIYNVVRTNYLLKLLNTEEFPQLEDLSVIEAPLEEGELDGFDLPPEDVFFPIITDAAIEPNPATSSATLRAVANDGIVIYDAEYYIDADPGQGNGFALTPSDGSFIDSFDEELTATIDTASLADGVHTIYIRARNILANWTDPAEPVEFIVDNSEPIAGVVNDGLGEDIDTQTSATTISANWSGFYDPTSDIFQYEWAIGTTAGGNDVQAFTSVGLATSATNSSLTLQGGVIYYVTVRAINGVGLSVSTFSDGVSLNHPPVANAGNDIIVECTHHDGEVVPLDGSLSFDPDGSSDIAKYEWFEGENLLGSGIILQRTFQLGLHTIVLKVTDTGGLSSTDEMTISITDTIAPTLFVTANPNNLWPPNHKLVRIRFSKSVSDACDPNPTVTLVSVTSSEADDARGAGRRGSNIVIQNGEVYLRAERSGKGSGRIYTITFKAVDSSGNETTASTQVTVSHDKGKKVARGHSNPPPNKGKTPEPKKDPPKGQGTGKK